MESVQSFEPVDDRVGDLERGRGLSRAGSLHTEEEARERERKGEGKTKRAKRFATVHRVKGEEMKATRSSPELKLEPKRNKKTKKTTNTKNESGSCVNHKKPEQESCDTIGEEGENELRVGPLLKQNRLKKSRSTTAIEQVEEERKRSTSREHDAVAEELEGPLPVREDMPERQRKRNQIINEIVNTERDYVRDLQVLLSVFLTPMQSQGIIAADEVKVMFSNVKTLLAINQTLLSDLIARVEATHGNSIGDSFLIFVTLAKPPFGWGHQGDYLRMYATYCANQEASYQMFSRCMKFSRPFREFLLLAQCDPQTNMMSLDGYLIKPIQRLCKYPLLLRELIGMTDKEHKDFLRLHRALDKIRKVVASVNDSKKLEEEMEAMAKVIERLHGTERFEVPLMVPGRKFFQEGTLHAKTKKGKERPPPYYFLFSDILVLGKHPKRAASAREKLVAPRVEVKEIVSLLSVPVNLKLQGGSNAIEVLSGCSQYEVRFETAELKKKWIESHQAALDRSASSSILSNPSRNRAS